MIIKLCQKYSCFLLAFLSILGCNGEEVPQEKLMAQVGDKTISVNEYIRRAEYTIRPPYCRTNNYIHRKIVLNSLIAEKLLALEAGENNELTANEDINLYLQGRKEQSMRQWLYNEEMVNQAVLDTHEIKKVFPLAGKKYDVNYISFSDARLAELIAKTIQSGETNIENIHRQLGGEEEVPMRTIGFNDPESDIIHDALFSDTLQIGQFIGPLKVEDNSYLLMQVKSGTRSVAITNNQIQERWDAVREKLTEKKANVRFKNYVKEIMAGKTITFEQSTFEIVVNVLGTDYYKTEQDKKEAFNQQIWNKDNPRVVLDDVSQQLENVMDQPLFEIDNQVYTVRMLQHEMKIHPLVFRKRKMKKAEFAEQLKLAIVDMIRDKYITADAYDKGYDQVPEVRRNYTMWRDNLLALYQREQFLKQFDTTDTDQMIILEKYLNPYIKELQQKYNDQIIINTDDFESTDLTDIDMFVIQTNVPYPVIVPSFPQFTTLNKLDYGRKAQ
jgi:hypothetical protein